MTNPLDNPAWAALTTHQAHLSRGGMLARRYRDDLAPIAALGGREEAALEELVGLIPQGDSVSLPATLEGITLPPQLTRTLDKNLVQMICETRVEVPPLGVVLGVLGEADIPEMLALTALTHPGPFRSHTYTLGLYLGIRVDGHLAAMGGQRMHLPGHREISAVCTHPDHRGRGVAAGLTALVAQRILERGEQPFLHHAVENDPARRVYEALGFEFHQEVSFGAYGAP